MNVRFLHCEAPRKLVWNFELETKVKFHNVQKSFTVPVEGMVLTEDIYILSSGLSITSAWSIIYENFFSFALSFIPIFSSS